MKCPDCGEYNFPNFKKHRCSGRLEEAITDRQQLIETLNEAAIIMQAGWMPTRWASWLGYLLEALQKDTDTEYYEEFLRCVKGAITARLEDGRW